MEVPAAAVGMPTGGGRITNIQMIAARGVGTTKMGAYCLVSGELLPIDPSAPNIRFQVALPFKWNGKAVMLGGGGFNGVIPKLDGNLQNTTPEMPTPLARGYAVFGSDSGHQAPAGPPPPEINHRAGEFLGNAEAYRNYVGDALKKDQLTALERRVEKSIDPGSDQIVTDLVGVPGRTRPACLYPSWPKYKGAGDMNDTRAFTCARNKGQRG
jgi:feruloyl esterase